ncbi:hypothetical protein NFI08_13445 [Halomonas sp. EF61]|uniref:tetratricopeptide repeat protein n=1 Tax=Halomonas sp. EF61 TaxID=2950869 RepID=UPI0032DE4DF9
MQKILSFVFFVFISACDNKETSGTERLALGESAFIVNNDSGPFSMAPFLKDIDLSDIIEKHQGGDAKSEYFLGVSLMYGYDVGMNKEEGVRILESAWKGGVVDAGYDLYEAYYYGGGASVDFVKALYYLIVSAENGYINSQREIAFAYMWCLGCSIDQKELSFDSRPRASPSVHPGALPWRSSFISKPLQPRRFALRSRRLLLTLPIRRWRSVLVSVT